MKHKHSSFVSARHQRGAAALIVTTVLFFAMVLVVVFVNRNLVFEQRASANQYRSTQAFEAAEAGAEWAVAQLNNPKRLGADCLPSSDSADSSFRTRYLRHTGGAFTPATWNSGSGAAALQPSCVRSNAGWACSCPQQGQPSLDTPTGDGPFPAFTLQFMAGDKPGSVRVVATGCTRLAGACVPGSTSNADATARVELTLGLLPGLRNAPMAALTTRGAVSADAAAFGAHNADPSSGVAIHAGAGIAANLVRLTTPAGAPLTGALVANDASLAGLSTEQIFAAHFGLDKERWKNQPMVTRIACNGDCSAAITAAMAAADGSTLLWLEGDMALAGPLTLGSPQRPVVLVVDGAARIRGAVSVHGVLYGQSLRWDDTPVPGAVLRGAAVSEDGYAGNGAPDLLYDSGVLTTLKTNSGSFARVNGSWRDF